MTDKRSCVGARYFHKRFTAAVIVNYNLSVKTKIFYQCLSEASCCFKRLEYIHYLYRCGCTAHSEKASFRLFNYFIHNAVFVGTELCGTVFYGFLNGFGLNRYFFFHFVNLFLLIKWMKISYLFFFFEPLSLGFAGSITLL